jgi:hypothetical protein
MGAILGVPPKDRLYLDAKITLDVTPDADLSSASAIRAYIVNAGGDETQWGSDQSGVSANTTVTADDTPEDLTVGGEPIQAGTEYTLRWVYEDSDGDENTITEDPIKFSVPSDG